MIRFLGRLARGIMTGALILAVIVGAPWLLLYYFGSPVPTSLPDMATVREWVDRPNTGEHLFAIVLLILWGGWAVFTYLIAVEVYAAIRRVRAPRIRLATPLHSVAASLVGATATVISNAAAQAAPPAPPVDPAIAAAPEADRTDLTDPVASDDVRVASPLSEIRYRVARGDWLAGIAQRFLGDADAYPRVAALNPQLAQLDPRFPDHIEPGWLINLPAEARDRGPIRHATGTLLAPPATPDAIQKPDPAAEPDPVATTPPPTPGTPSPPAVSVYPYPDATDTDTDDPAPMLGGSRIGAMSGAGLLATIALLALEGERRRQAQYRRPGQRLPNPRNGATERDLRVAEAPADVQRLDLALRHLTDALADRTDPPDIIGVRLSGGDVHLLLAGEPAEPPDPWLDEGTHWVLPGTTPLPVLPITERPVPTLTAVGSRAGRHLLLDLERHTTVTITGDVDRGRALLRYMVCELACNTWSEDAEILVAGFNDQEAAHLKELNPQRVVVVTSVRDAATQLRRHIVAARRMLHALGLPDTLHGRLRGVAVDAWTPRVLLIHNPTHGDQDILTGLHRELSSIGRCAAAVVATVPAGPPIGEAVLTVADDATLTIAAPHLRSTIAAAGLPAIELERVAEILRLARITDLPDAESAEPLTRTAPELADAGTPDDADTADVIRNLYDPDRWPPGAAAAPAQDRSAVVAPALSTDDDPTLDADLDTWHTHDANPPRIAVLGHVAVTASGIPPDGRKAMHAEIAVYLAVHPRGANQYQLADALWPNGVNEKTVRVMIASLRRWLGQTPDDQPWLPDARETNGLYRLRPGYLVDWHLMRRLQARARRRGKAGIDDLRTALTLVRGRPLAGTDTLNYGRKQYTWLGESEIFPPLIHGAIIDIAHHLAELYLEQGDTDGARWAVQHAWIADPDRTDDQPWIDLMRAEHIDSNRAELQRLHDQLLHYRGAEVPEDLAPTTFTALDALLGV